MEQISVLLAVCLLPAALNDISMYRKRRVTACVSGNDADRYEKKETWLFAALIVAVLTVYGGLRTSFNDTYFYIHAYERLRGFESFSDMDMSLGANPGFFFLNVLLSEAGLSFHWLLLLTSFVSQFCVIWFFRRYSPSMTMSVLMYICSGAYLFSLAAIKQCVATGLCLSATHHMLKGRKFLYLALVAVAATVHPYALLYLVAPLLTVRPWKATTYLILAAAAVAGAAFTELVQLLAGITSGIGEEYTAEYLSGEGVNFLRLLVYSVPVVFSFVRRRELYTDSDRAENLMSNMSVLCFALMFLALFGTANMFARLANYFQMFMMAALPWMLLKCKGRLQAPVVYAFAACYMVFAFYSYADFGMYFRRITLAEFILGG